MSDANVRGPQFSLLGATSADTSALSRSTRTAWLACRRTDAGKYEFWDGDRCVQRLDFADAQCELADLTAIVGLVGDAGLAQLEKEWAESLPGRPVTFCRASDFTPPAVLAAANDVLARALVEERMRRGEAILELATYRDEFDRLQHDYAALEAFLATTDVRTLRQVFEYPGGGDGVDLADPSRAETAAAVPAGLRQLLPVAAVGVAELAILVMSVPEKGGAALVVALHAEETGEIVAQWALEPQATSAGWVRLALDRAVDQIGLSLFLEIIWPDDRPGWKIAFGPPHPNAVMRARARGGDVVFAAPLAMRVASAPPGLRPARSLDAVRPADAPLGSTIWVPEAALQSVKNVTAATSDPAHVHYNPEEGFIQVHPIAPGQATVGRLVVDAPARTWRLTARIWLAHPEANPTDFALAISEGPTPLPNPELADTGGAGPGFSGWREVKAQQHASLSVLLVNPNGGRLSVFLLTRQALTPEYAWARFGQLQFHRRP